MSAPAAVKKRPRRDFEMLERDVQGDAWTGAKVYLQEEGLGFTVLGLEHHGRQVEIYLSPAQVTALAWELLSRAAAAGRAA